MKTDGHGFRETLVFRALDSVMPVGALLVLKNVRVLMLSVLGILKDLGGKFLIPHSSED